MDDSNVALHIRGTQVPQQASLIRLVAAFSTITIDNGILLATSQTF